MAGLHWFILIKLCRLLSFVGLSFVADWLGEITGLTVRLIALCGEIQLDA